MIPRLQNIKEEKLITKQWNFKKSKVSDFPDGILVTGANSFIGVHIVALLQKKIPGKIHLLIRGKDHQEAVSKMINAFIKWGLDDFNKDMVIIHTGDVCLEKMGLTNEEYDDISINVGVVIHLAMKPLYHLPYHFFETNWLPELEKMITFCGNSKSPKTLHYASSFNANFFVTDEDFNALNTNAWQSGYAGFKWVANKSIQNAFNQQLRGCIYDIPLVIGSKENGICPDHYSIWYILSIFLKTKLYFPFSFKIIPVDILAEIMVYNIIQEKLDKAAQFVRPVLVDVVSEKLFDTFAEAIGLNKSIKEIARESYNNKLRFDFMIPENFNELLEKVNHLQPVLPENFKTDELPLSSEVFYSNLVKYFQKNEGLFSLS